ncbi:hypothetical protein ACSAZL_12090 [Methanosarcina sp. T3]|uniref:hypothetical protein n=1 Tax=Methanosarcina sp. T3 TaxID=3439062 RepID=UPI003F87659A
MNPKPIIAVAFIISVIVITRLFIPGYIEQFREGKYIHVDNIVMEFDETNATVDVEYHLAPFAQAYVFFFGSKNIEPKIKEIFSEFPETKIQKIGLNSATLQITNISEINGEDYTHDSTKLGLRPDVLTIVYPYNQGTRKLQNPDSTISIFYPIHPENQN